MFITLVNGINKLHYHTVQFGHYVAYQAYTVTRAVAKFVMSLFSDFRFACYLVSGRRLFPNLIPQSSPLAILEWREVVKGKTYSAYCPIQKKFLRFNLDDLIPTNNMTYDENRLKGYFSTGAVNSFQNYSSDPNRNHTLRLVKTPQQLQALKTLLETTNSTLYQRLKKWEETISLTKYLFSRAGYDLNLLDALVRHANVLNRHLAYSFVL